jgi:hypothetical protein
VKLALSSQTPTTCRKLAHSATSTTCC